MRFLMMSFLAATVLSAPVRAETITLGLNGLVCAFCAAGIEKSFKKEVATDQVDVNLDAKRATVITKPGQTFDDATLTRIVTDAGYTLTSITRGK